MITGLILAGGRGERMGGIDKGLQTFRGLPLIHHAIERLTPQVNALMINANHHLTRYAGFGVPVCTDAYGDFAGPLAGMEAGLRSCDTPLLLTAPCDCPFLPEDLSNRLYEALVKDDADVAVAATGTSDATQLHPVCCLLKAALLPQLSAYLKDGGRKVREWQAAQKMVIVHFANELAFRNLNTLAELRELE